MLSAQTFLDLDVTSKTSEPRFALDTQHPAFALEFDSSQSAYYTGIKFHNDCDAEVVKWEDEEVDDPSARNKIEPSCRRWTQLLHGAKKIARWYYRNILSGKLNIVRLAKKYGCTVQHGDTSYIRTEMSSRPKCKILLDDADSRNTKITVHGFSVPEEKMIFVNDDSGKNQKRFATAHELAHFLLGHNEFAFCKTSGDLLEREECNEEADKLAAMLLMPHSYIKKNMKVSDEKLAKRLGVPVDAVRKRKKEVEKEIGVLRYDQRY